MSVLDHADQLRIKRYRTYDHIGLAAAVRDEIEAAIRQSPAKNRSGRGGLLNMRTEGSSRKSETVLRTESHTVEQVHKHECDLNPAVQAYYVQVPIRHLVREFDGRKHVSNARLDALVFEEHRIVVRECKTEDWLIAAIDRNARDWQLLDSKYVHVPLDTWAKTRGLIFEAWHPPRPVAFYASNLSTLVHSSKFAGDDEYCARVEELCSMLSDERIHTLESVLRTAPWVSHRHVHTLLASGRLFGTLKSRLLDDPDFFIGSDLKQVRLLDDAGLATLSRLDSPADVKSWLNTTSEANIRFALKRLSRLKGMKSGTEEWTPHYKSLHSELECHWNNPNELLRQLCPAYDRSGNREPRLHEDMYPLLDSYQVRWEKGAWKTHLEAWGDYEVDCSTQGLVAASKTTFYTALRRSDPSKRALATQGARGFQKSRRRTPPTLRSTPTILVRHTVHIDSTMMDVRAFLARGELDLIRGWVYVCRDVHGKPLARSFVIGNARTQGVALLWRDYVNRWRELPSLVHKDGGPDQTSKWHRRFAEGRFDLRLQQTGNSPANQPAEDIVNHVNSYVCHQLEGNTLADRFGRAIDGRFKSQRTARHLFGFITSGIDEFLNLAAPQLVNSQLTTYHDDAEFRATQYGTGGSPVSYDDDLLIATSLPVTFTHSEKNGIRTTDGYFLNTDMQTAIRTCKPEQVLADSSDPSLLWVRVNGRWFKALRNDALMMANLSPEQRLAVYFTQRDIKAARREHHEKMKLAHGRKLRKDAEHHANPVPIQVVNVPAAEDLDLLPEGYRVSSTDLYGSL